MILFDIQHLKSSDAVFGSRPSKYFGMEYPALFRQLIWKALQRKRLKRLKNKLIRINFNSVL